MSVMLSIRTEMMSSVPIKNSTTKQETYQIHQELRHQFGIHVFILNTCVYFESMILNKFAF
jgi:hypothetical protein